MAEIHIAIRSSIWCSLLNWDTELEISSYRTAVSRVFHQGVLHFFIATRNKGLCSVHMSPHVTRAFVPSLYIPDRTPACNPSVLYDTTPHQNVHLYDCMVELQAGWMVLRMVWCTAWYPALPYLPGPHQSGLTNWEYSMNIFLRSKHSGCHTVTSSVSTPYD